MDSSCQNGVLHAKIEISAGCYVQVFNLHPQCTNFYFVPEQTEYSRMVRNLSFRELVNLLKLKLTPDCSDDLCLVAGDFNVFRYSTSNQLVKTLFDKDARWSDFFNVIDTEYESLLATLKDGGNFEVVNVWDRDNKGKKCISLGECNVGDDGIVKPIETVL